MVKKIKLCFYAFFVCGVFLFLFSACSQNILKECENKISDERENYFEGQTQNYYVSFSSGMRESPYVLNGKSENCVEFGIVTIKPKTFNGEEMLNYEIYVDNDEFCGEFEKSPFDDTYGADLGKKVDNNAVIIVKINNGNSEEVAEMTNAVNSFKISSHKALEIALNELGEKYYELRKKDFEIYIKIVADITNKMPDKFYLVMFLDESGNSLSVIVNPKTGECEIKKL